MAKFKKGDICIVIWSKHHPHLIGSEVTLTSDLMELNYKDYGLGMGYRTNVPRFCPKEFQLKLRDPPNPAIKTSIWAWRKVFKLKADCKNLALVKEEQEELSSV